jgi:hypothetical protein
LIEDTWTHYATTFVIDVCFKSPDGLGSEVEKLRKKRLRLRDIDNPDLRDVDLKACFYGSLGSEIVHGYVDMEQPDGE